MNTGILAAICAYAGWGLLPIYWKQLQHVPADQILSHRIVWSFVMLIIFLQAGRRLGPLWRGLSLKVCRLYGLSGLVIGVNWFIYVWSVNSGHVVESSLGYFINPLFSVLLGVIFLRERLRPRQWLPLGLAAAGVIYLTFDFGRPPWIALSLAVTFSIYSLIKKKSPLGAFEGLTLETIVLLPPALIWLAASESRGLGVFLHANPASDLLLVGTGLVTALPLALFAVAARRIALSTIGMLQYMSPSIQFLLGVFLYQEPFSRAQLVGFGMVWTAILLFFLEQLRTRAFRGRTRTI